MDYLFCLEMVWVCLDSLTQWYILKSYTTQRHNAEDLDLKLGLSFISQHIPATLKY
jgi:hypothetical protein